MRVLRVSLLFAAVSLFAAPQNSDGNLRPKDVREIAKEGSAAMPKLRALLKNPELEIRIEAVKAIVQTGTQHSLDPLIEATRDADAEIQIRATDGLVNFYQPGYVQSGLSASFRRAGTRIVSRFSDTNDAVIPPYIQPRPDVIDALGKLARGGAGQESRANAARAVGVLRGASAIPDLIEGLRSKDTNLIYETLIALQKIREPKVASNVVFLLRDLDPKVQIAAIETTGILRNKDALPDLADVLNRTRNTKVRRAALTSIAMLPDPKNREIFARYLEDKDEGMRGAAAEGYGWLADTSAVAVLGKAFEEEKKLSPRLSLAFALVMLGNEKLSEESPLQYLMNALNSSARKGEAFPLLVELTRKPAVRAAIYPALPQGTKDEKIQIAQILARSGGPDSSAPLESLTHDANSEVVQEAVRALQALKARI
ncbi:MAG: HEAT repeat domain-containing protein [Bryobacterales bacterium]|nr:HEAT repeat domain-containing protein [Bryobacterales bacterium]